MPLPSPYDAWYEAITGAPAPEERGATCSDCPMCALRGFDPHVTCCTYIPPMANFRAGQALLAGGEAADAVRRRLRTARVQRLGLLPTRAEERLYDGERSRFGATDAVVCPFLSERGDCSVWAWRDVTCATWFCRHDAGQAGQAHWDAAADVLGLAEGLVAAHVAPLVGDPPTRAGYQRAARAAQALTWEQIRALPGGEALAPLEQELREAVTALEAPVGRACEARPR